MTVLITGATGLVGSMLSNRLIQNGHTVHYLTTKTSKIVNTPNKKGFYWNIETQEIDKHCIDDVTVIIHLAGAPVVKRWTKDYKDQIFESRVGGLNLLHKLLNSSNNSVNHLISSSGISIYEDSLEIIHDEDSTHLNTNFLADVVKSWEQAADQFLNSDCKVSKIRTGVVLAKRNSALQKIAQPIHYGLGASLGSGNQIMSWIHISDLVNAFIFLINSKLSGTFNGVAPNPESNKTVTKVIANKLKKPLFLPPVPPFMLNLLLGESSTILLESQIVKPRKLHENGFKFDFETIEEAIDDLM